MATGSVDQQIQDLKTQLVGAFRTLGTFLADLKTQVGSVKETVEALQSRGASSTPSGAQITREEYQQSIQLIAQHLRTLAGEIGELKAQAAGAQNDDALTAKLDALAQTPAELERVVREALARFGQQLEASFLEDGQFYGQLRGRLDQFDASLRALPQEVLKAPQWICLDELPAITAGLEELRAAAKEQLARPAEDPEQLRTLVSRVDDLQTSAAHLLDALGETRAAVTSTLQEQQDEQTRHLEEAILAARPADLTGNLEALPARIAALLPPAEQVPQWGQHLHDELEAVRALVTEYTELARNADARSELDQLLGRVDWRLDEASRSWRDELARLSLPGAVAPVDNPVDPEGRSSAASLPQLQELSARLELVLQQVTALDSSLDSRLDKLSAISSASGSANSNAVIDLAPLREQLAGLEAAVRMREEPLAGGIDLTDELKGMETRLEQTITQLRDLLQSESERSTTILETLADRPAPQPPAGIASEHVVRRLQSLEEGVAVLVTRLEQFAPIDPAPSLTAAANSVGERLEQRVEQRLHELEELIRTPQPAPHPGEDRLQALEAHLEALDKRLSTLQVPDATPAIQSLAAAIESRFQQLELAVRRPVVVPPPPSRPQPAHSSVVAEDPVDILVFDAPDSGQQTPAGSPETPSKSEMPDKPAGAKARVPPKPETPKPESGDGEDVNALLLEALGLESH